MRVPELIDEDVRALLREARQLEPEPPTFRHLWRRAGRQRTPRGRRGLRLRRAMMATAGAILIISSSAAWLGKVRAARQTAEVEALLASLQAVESTPLDFLLETPGVELMRQIPRIGATPDPLDLSLFQHQEN